MKREDSKKSLEKYFGEKILGKLKTLHKEILPQPPYEDYCQGYLSVLQKSEEDFNKKIEEIFNLWNSTETNMILSIIVEKEFNERTDKIHSLYDYSSFVISM